jgi:hypothetical protein
MKCLQILLGLLILTVSIGALAQCPMGAVKVYGRVDNVTAAATEISVTLETPQGKKSMSAPVSSGEFSIDVPFGTQSSSYFPLWGHRCNNLPKLVDVTAKAADQVLSTTKLSLKDDFALESPFVYRLKHELVLRPPKSS